MMGSSSDVIYSRVDLESLCEVSKAKSSPSWTVPGYKEGMGAQDSQ